MRGAPIGSASWVDPDGTAHHEGTVHPVHVAGDHEVVQRYLAGTPVVQTVFVTRGGATGVVDLVWDGRLVRLLHRYTGDAGISVDGALDDDALRVRALEHWWSVGGEPEGAAAELRALSRSLAVLLDAEPGELRDPGDVDELGLWRHEDGRVDVGAHAAFGAAG